MSLRFIGLACMLLLSCTRETADQLQPAQPETSVSPITPADPAEKKSEEMPPLPIPNAGVVATQTASQSIRILFTGAFHSDEVEEGIDQLPWLALFSKEDERFSLTKTVISATRVTDGLLDDETKGEMTGWEINLADGETPVMLVCGSQFSEGDVRGATLPMVVYPGDSVAFTFLDTEYLLYATGSSQLDSVSGMHLIRDYSLFLVRQSATESLTTLLVSHASFDDTMTTILWSGDLDRDGYLDLLIDMTHHYNLTLPTLFLSKPAAPGKPVVPVASHSSVGC